MRVTLPVYALVLLLLPAAPAAAESPAAIEWHPWSDEVFERARREQRFVLLDLEAVWCHWCHVMDRETYANTAVAEVINRHYLAVKVDQDARPDLSGRYKAYGWPATIVFAPDGTEIVKRAGYIEPAGMRKLLLAIVADPSPESAALTALPENLSMESRLPPAVRGELLKRHREFYDASLGGLPLMQKFLKRDSVEYALHLASRGNRREEERARQTLDAALNLLDPVWGGFYQYSVRGDWHHPHYEKIMPTQAGYLRLYALAWGMWREPRYLNAAAEVVRYLDDFLTAPGGAFYTSQDADRVPGEKSAEYFALGDAERRTRGMPRVDTHIYARENGWMIEALATLYEFTHEPEYLNRALGAAAWIEQNRTLPGGGYRHDAHDPAGPYLGDTLAMARACLQLYRVTADRRWLDRSITAAAFMREHFIHPGGGMATATADNTPITPLPEIDENIAFVRFMNLLANYTGDAGHRELAEHAMRYLATADVATAWATQAGILLSDDELSADPLHLTIVGSKGDEAARTLFHAALKVPAWYKRVEWWDRQEGDLPNPDVRYPQLDRAAAFLCTEKRCSFPLYTPEDMTALIAASEKG